MDYTKEHIDHILEQYIRNRKYREIMSLYLTDYCGSMMDLAEECDTSWSTVKRAINHCSFVYKYLPGIELKLTKK